MKYYGAIGFVETVETSPDVWEPKIKEYLYAGDINRVSQSWRSADKINDDIVVNMEISFIGDIHALENYNNIRYAVWRGTKWRVSSITEEHPRINLMLGGEYNDKHGSKA